MAYKLDLASGESYDGATIEALSDSTQNWIVRSQGHSDTVPASGIRRIRAPINPTWITIGLVAGLFVDLCIVTYVRSNFGN